MNGARGIGLLLAAAAAAACVALLCGWLGAADPLLISILVVHALGAAALLAFGRRRGGLARPPRRRARLARFVLLRGSEPLFLAACIAFLFAFIYATNANLDYVQRFMLFHDNLRLAPDSRAERLAAVARYGPFLLVDAAWYIIARLARPRRLARAAAGGPLAAAGAWALPLVLASALLFALSFPSFARTAGLPALGWVALVPLFLALRSLTPGWAVVYGTAFGVLQAMLCNYWLGTFNLLTLQFAAAATAVQYVPFTAVAVAVGRRARGAWFLVFPAAWTVFDWARSQGFLGYPWGMPGSSQYPVLPVIQVASVAGVWAVTFLVVLVNAVLAWYAEGALSRIRRGPAPAIACAAVIAAALGWAGVGAIRDARAAAHPQATARVALVQQDTDPRKDDYAQGFDVLRRLSDQAAAADPDLVVWSETAFVPNIRRWSEVAPADHPWAALVRDFQVWQRGLGRWLVTGNDDYDLRVVEGEEVRTDYNGAILFAPDGARVDTYHKIHLVPFTEYFPYKEQLPSIYRLLQGFDAYLWEPGSRRVVFRVPTRAGELAFSTPICFEDGFPADVREFVRAGAAVIVNLSNDYWSLTETEAMQHAANAVFRAVENGVPLARASASGLTCLVSPRGKILARAPMYEPAFLVVHVAFASAGGAGRPATLYTRWGDWFPAAMAVLLAGLAALAAVSVVRGNGARRAGRRR